MPPTNARMLPALRRHPYTILLTFILIGLAIPFCRRSDSDWDGVYLAAARHLRDGEPIAQNGYLYPPVSAWLALPFADMPRVAGRLAWYAVNVVAILVVLISVWRLAGGGRLEGQPPVPRRENVIVLLGLLTGIYYLFDALSNQQTDLVLAALSIGGCVLVTRGRELEAAVSFGIAAGMKCTPLLWAPYLAWRGRWLAGSLVVAVAIGINLLPDLTHPPADGAGRLKQWAERFLKPMAGSDHDPGTWGSFINFNHSVAGVCNRLLIAERVWGADDFSVGARPNRMSAGVLKAIVYSTCLLFVIAALVTSRRRMGQDEAGEFGLVLILMLLLSPMSSKPHFCTLLLPGFFLARRAVERRHLLPRILLGGAIAAGLMSNKDLVGRYIYDTAIWYGSVFWNTVFLFGGCVATMWPRRKKAGQARPLPLAA